MEPGTGAAWWSLLSVESPPLLPELRMHLATPRSALWSMDRAQLAVLGLEYPFWAFAWAGGVAQARWVLDHRACVAGRTVLDVGSGGGVVALAAALAGASHVVAADVDPHCALAVERNAALNGLPRVRAWTGDVLEAPADAAVILAADVCYGPELTARMVAWLESAAQAGSTVYLADARRGFLRASPRWTLVHSQAVPVERALEDATVRHVDVFVAA